MFASKVMSFVNLTKDFNLEDKKQQLENSQLLKLLPDDLRKPIEENLERYNFIDYELVNIALKEDSLSNEIELLKEEEEGINKKIESQEIITKEIQNISEEVDGFASENLEDSKTEIEALENIDDSVSFETELPEEISSSIK